MKKIKRSSYWIFHKKCSSPLLWSFLHLSFLPKVLSLHWSADSFQERGELQVLLLGTNAYYPKLTFLCTILAKYCSCSGTALVECMKHLCGGQKETQGENASASLLLIWLDNDKYIQSTAGEKSQYAILKEKLCGFSFPLWSTQPFWNGMIGIR